MAQGGKRGGRSRKCGRTNKIRRGGTNRQQIPEQIPEGVYRILQERQNEKERQFAEDLRISKEVLDEVQLAGINIRDTYYELKWIFDSKHLTITGSPLVEYLAETDALFRRYATNEELLSMGPEDAYVRVLLHFYTLFSFMINMYITQNSNVKFIERLYVVKRVLEEKIRMLGFTLFERIE